MLPKIASTVHTYTTMTGEKILFTQFNGGHEKILLEAKESQDEEIIIQSVMEVLRSIVRRGDVDKLPTFEIESLLLQSRIFSVGSTVEVVIKDPDTEEKVELSIDLSKAKLTSDIPETRISIGHEEETGNEVFLNLKFPTFADLSTYKKISDEAKIRLCLESIESGGNYVDISDASDEEFSEWLLSLEKSTILKLQKFVESIPRLELNLDYTLKDGTKKSILLKDFKDFFM